MRLITWNCKGGFARKHEAIARLQPDVLVLPEAGRFNDISQLLGVAPVNSVQWIGANPNKGLGVLSYGDYSLAVHEAYLPELRWILPLEVSGPVSFLLFAVWTMPSAPSGTYAQCLFDACDHYRDLLRSPRVVLAGDFNANVAFDKPNHPLNFANLLSRFAQADLQSLYHLERGCAHGEETEPTFFLYHHAERRHHLDFVFATPAVHQDGFSISVGDHAEWSKASDHMPLVCSFGTHYR